MLEIVFGSSACGSLKSAQHYGEGAYSGAAFGVIGHADNHTPTLEEIEALRREEEVKMRADWARATPMGGNTADVYGLQLVLSIGDISEDVPGDKRLQTLKCIYSNFPTDDGYDFAQRDFSRANRDLAQLRGRMGAGEPVRIWYSEQPDEACGLCWFLALLQRWDLADARVSIVKLPAWDEDEQGAIRSLGSWSEVRAADWHRFLAHETPASPTFMLDRASRWFELQAENAPLRAVVNGKLVGVPEAFYDGWIRREIDGAAAEGEPFLEAIAIARVLGLHQLGIGDGWVASRIATMIEGGEVEVVAEAGEGMSSYARLLRRR